MLSKKFILTLSFFLVVFSLTISLSYFNEHEQPLPGNAAADKILVEKGERRLTLFRQGKPLKIYRISLGGSPLGHKRQEGDGKTPEGVYRIDRRNPKSGYHLALHVSYPDENDSAQAAAKNVAPGGDIMIHGIRNGLGWLGSLHRSADWTQGCIALTNAEIEEIWRAVPDGTPIVIEP